MKERDKQYLIKRSMSRHITAIMLTFCVVTLSGQTKDFKIDKIDASFGLSYPKDAIPNGFGIGVLTAIEPKKDINNFSVGTRVGLNILRSTPDWDFVSKNLIDKFDVSLLLTGDYYLTKGRFRPFLGIGTGLFLLSATEGYDITSENGKWKSYGVKFGGLARCGIEMPYVRVSFCYNYIGGKEKSSYGHINFDYISVTVSGWFKLKKNASR